MTLAIHIGGERVVAAHQGARIRWAQVFGSGRKAVTAAELIECLELNWPLLRPSIVLVNTNGRPREGLAAEHFRAVQAFCAEKGVQIIPVHDRLVRSVFTGSPRGSRLAVFITAQLLGFRPWSFEEAEAAAMIHWHLDGSELDLLPCAA